MVIVFVTHTPFPYKEVRWVWSERHWIYPLLYIGTISLHLKEGRCSKSPLNAIPGENPLYIVTCHATSYMHACERGGGRALHILYYKYHTHSSPVQYYTHTTNMHTAYCKFRPMASAELSHTVCKLGRILKSSC